MKKNAIGSRQERIGEIVNRYLEYINEVGINGHVGEEGYKFEFVDNFQKKFDLDANNLAKMIETSIEDSNLVIGANYLPKKSLLGLVEVDEKGVKSALKELFDEKKDIAKRIDAFKSSVDKIQVKVNKKYKKEGIWQNYIDVRFISILLSSKYPEKYYPIKARQYRYFEKFIDDNFLFPKKMSDGEKYLFHHKYAEELNKYIKSNSKIDEIRSQVTREIDFKDKKFHWMAQDVIYIAFFILNKGEEIEEIDKIEKKEQIKVVRKIEDKAEVINFKDLLNKTNFEKNNLSNFHSLGDPQRIRIEKIVSNCYDKKWMLPHFQRYFDWRKEDIQDFWESIVSDYYVGSFLMWESGQDLELGVQPIGGVESDGKEAKPDMIILDGQQRITSIYYAVKAPNGVSLKGNKNAKFYFYINFYKLFVNKENDNLVEFYQDQITGSESIEQMLFPLCQLENYNTWVFELQDYLLEKFPGADETRKIVKLIGTITKKLDHILRGFEIPFVALPKSMKLFQVVDIFEKINTKGKPLDVFDLLIARLYKYKIELRELWNKEGNEKTTLAKYPNIRRYYVDGKNNKIPIYILQSMSLLYEKNSSAKRSDVLNIYSNVYEAGDRNFQDDWMDISGFLDVAIEKLENLKESGFGVKDENSLPFSAMIPVITALMKVISEKEEKAKCYRKLSQWYWSAIFTNAYSQSADSQMTSDFKEMKKWFKDENDVPKVVLKARKELSLGYTDFRDIQTWSNAKYRGIMSLLAIEGSKDFDTSQTLENAKGNDRDHLFPKSLKLKDVDSILNMTWMSEETNRKIKIAKKPSVYVGEFISDKYDHDEEKFKEVLKTHFISERGYSFLVEDRFDDFILEREKTILKKIKDLIGFKETDIETSLLTPEKPFTNKAILIETLQSCDDYILWVDKYFSREGLYLLTQADLEERIKEIRIISSISKISESFRSQFKAFKEEMENGGIKCEMRIILDLKVKSSIHDRFIVSKHTAFNIPSTDTIAVSQISEVLKSQNRNELEKIFDRLWGNSFDLIEKWDKIKENLTE